MHATYQGHAHAVAAVLLAFCAAHLLGRVEGRPAWTAGVGCKAAARQEARALLTNDVDGAAGARALSTARPLTGAAEAASFAGGHGRAAGTTVAGLPKSRPARRPRGPRVIDPPAASPPAHGPPPPSIGRHAAHYLQLAATARSGLMGGAAVEYTFHDRSALAANETLRPLRIAQYSQVYFPAWTGNFTGCDRPCLAVGGGGDAGAAAGADVVVINMMDPVTPWTRPPGQVWVGSYFESPDHYSVLRNADILARFNYTTGYRPDADFPVFSMVQDTAQWLDMTLAWPQPAYALKRGRPMMSTWISNCAIDSVGRLGLLEALDREGVSIASYGKCGPGQRRPDLEARLAPEWRAWAGSGSGPQKAAVSAQHLFMYAAENSACAYYTTEKVWHGLLAGAVPVYVGDAVFLKKLAPPGSVIYAADFDGAPGLAAYLKRLASNRSAYEAHLAWRGDAHALDPLHRFMSLPTWEARHPGPKACALCEFLWAAPKRVRPDVSSDLCQPVLGGGGGGRARFRLRL